MYIGIIYDAYTGDHWYRIGRDIDSVKSALQAIKLPLPTAGIFDSSKNDLVEMNEKYRDHRTDLLDKARSIFKDYLIKNPKEPQLLYRPIKYSRRIKEPS